MSELRRVARAGTKRSVIRGIYDAVAAPQWAAPNLDGLADVLRDLSWLPPGPVRLEWHVAPLLPPADRAAIAEVLARAASETADGQRPVTVRTMG